MVHKSLWVRLQAKPEKAQEVGRFLTDAVKLANQEERTIVWFALQLGPETFGVFDAFADDRGRQAHLEGPIAKALMAKASELLSEPPKIEHVDVLAAKLSG
jgi:quinol monooxygenase YgiN